MGDYNGDRQVFLKSAVRTLEMKKQMESQLQQVGMI